MGSKTEKFFVREISKIDLGFVWDVQPGVLRNEVAGKDDQSVGDTRTTRRSDNWARSQSPQSRRSMFGKADPGPTACRTRRRMCADWGGVRHPVEVRVWNESL